MRVRRLVAATACAGLLSTGMAAPAQAEELSSKAIESVDFTGLSTDPYWSPLFNTLILVGFFGSTYNYIVHG